MAGQRTRHGYDEQWFREFAAEQREVKRTPGGRHSVVWEKKRGLAGTNHAWDARVYATAAACFVATPLPLRDALFRSALKHAMRRDSTATPDEIAKLRAIIGLQESYGAPSAGNVVPIRGDE